MSILKEKVSCTSGTILKRKPANTFTVIVTFCFGLVHESVFHVFKALVS